MKRVDSSPELPNQPPHIPQVENRGEDVAVQQVSRSRFGWLGDAFWHLLGSSKSHKPVKAWQAPCAKLPGALKAELIGVYKKDPHRSQVIENFFALIGPMMDRSQKIQNTVLGQLKLILSKDELIEPFGRFVAAALEGHKARQADMLRDDNLIELPALSAISMGYVETLPALHQALPNNHEEFQDLFAALRELGGMPNFQLYTDYEARVHYDPQHASYPKVRGDDLLTLSKDPKLDPCAAEAQTWGPEEKILAARGYWTRQNAFLWNISEWERLDSRPDPTQKGRHIVRAANYTMGNAVPGLFAREITVEIDFRPWLPEDCSFEQSKELFDALNALLRNNEMGEYEKFVSKYYSGQSLTWLDATDFASLLDYLETLKGDFERSGTIDSAQLQVLMSMPHESNEFPDVKDISHGVFHPKLLQSLYCLETLLGSVKDPWVLARFVELADAIGLDKCEPEHLAHVHAQITRLEAFLGADLSLEFRVDFYEKLKDPELQKTFLDFDEALHEARNVVSKIDSLGVKINSLPEISNAFQKHAALIEIVGQTLANNEDSERLQRVINKQYKVAVDFWYETDERLISQLFERASKIYGDAWGQKMEAFYRKRFQDDILAFDELKSYLDKLSDTFTAI